MELENRCCRKNFLFKGCIFRFYVSFQGYIPSENAKETANRKHNVYWVPGSGTTSPQPFRRSHVRFVTDVDGVFTKRLVSSGNFACWCEMLMRGPFPTDGILFLREFGVEVLSLLTTSHLALASSGVVLFCWFGGSVGFAIVVVKLSLWQCQMADTQLLRIEKQRSKQLLGYSKILFNTWHFSIPVEVAKAHNIWKHAPCLIPCK